jgi:hypothetical protein
VLRAQIEKRNGHVGERGRSALAGSVPGAAAVRAAAERRRRHVSCLPAVG